ncbi:helix-turn-helix transcriptional regulator [Shewanella oncorhynchi]|uniref:helix-turn-helix transcriptional regulator n=1 Tax=Shewanella oncorhynchi TaxID=2726434 RepID=UPI003D7A16FA
MSDYYKLKNNKFRFPLDKPSQYDGGKVLIERLIHLFKVKNRIELADLIGVTAGTLSTWTTRETVPHELLIRIHLATGVSMEYLCFGTGLSYGEDLFQVNNPKPQTQVQTEPDEAYKMPLLNMFDIENGKLRQIDKYRIDDNFFFINRISPRSEDFLLKSDGKHCFINANETTVTKGCYLFSINGSYQVGDLRQMPDGNIYFFDGDDKYPINADVTKIHGKVVSILETV